MSGVYDGSTDPTTKNFTARGLATPELRFQSCARQRRGRRHSDSREHHCRGPCRRQRAAHDRGRQLWELRAAIAHLTPFRDKTKTFT